ncbi:MAG: GNAT family N-acetyltransferase [Rhodospirillaceae bacterium]|nr:GNAT family N-acetyltransferase [Rhodospirillaceae bacterium]
MILRGATPLDTPMFAALHATSFPDPWPAESFAAMLSQPGVAGWLAGDPPEGMLLARAVADEAEILTLAVVPAARRKGAGGALLGEMLRVLQDGGTRRVFLEVAANNAAALALYARFGFVPCGRRAGYYAGGADAIIMERAL